MRQDGCRGWRRITFRLAPHKGVSFLRRAKRKASTFCKSPGQTVTLVPSGALVRWLLCEGMCGDHQTVTKNRPACADGSIAGCCCWIALAHISREKSTQNCFPITNSLSRGMCSRRNLLELKCEENTYLRSMMGLCSIFSASQPASQCALCW